VQEKTIAFHSYKGGTGKTTVITNLGAHLVIMERGFAF
jgi:MinD-like ATPase involved in chromosome partitioning or flagellar assembly